MTLSPARIAAIVLAAACTVATAAPGAVLPLHYGANTIAWPGAPGPAIAFLARRDNFNAHGFDVLTFYVEDTKGGEGDAAWHVMPFYDGLKEALELHASGGADCLLHDFRVIAEGASGLRVVVAERAPGPDFVTPGQVSFRFYALRHNTEQYAGWPPHYFERVETRRSQRRYCDVGEALQAELGLGGR
ncbi:hypothetical protein [Rubrivivax gelatinosus]|uniref:hypothetical protein n=1 Tax=Rubrivivax gelatinosus TaxID=28068 RepID=UPI0002E54B5D|nr:hypothetical protein [Rubrivivax gelatinosus]MBG6081875.1 hypothetical protein [Rubrivivax gelatinosus]